MASTLGELALDVNGTSESRVVAWDFKNFPEITGGDTLLSSPAPVIEFSPATPALTVGVPVISGTQVQATVSITSGVVGTRYTTSCRVSTAAGRVLINTTGALLLIGPS